MSWLKKALCLYCLENVGPKFKHNNLWKMLLFFFLLVCFYLCTHNEAWLESDCDPLRISVKVPVYQSEHFYPKLRGLEWVRVWKFEYNVTHKIFYQKMQLTLTLMLSIWDRNVHLWLVIAPLLCLAVSLYTYLYCIVCCVRNWSYAGAFENKHKRLKVFKLYLTP